jgi:hypothetical protein
MNWSTAEAKVLAQVYSGGAGRRSNGYTLITSEFQTRDGRTFTAKGTLDGHRPKLATVIIYYDPNQPQRNLVDPEGAKFIGYVATLLGTASTAAGALVIISGILTIRNHRRENHLFEQKRAEELRRRANDRS